MSFFNKPYFKIGLIALLLVAAVLVTPKFYSFSAKPCTKPIEYSIGLFDSKFKISQADFLNAVTAAEKIWEQPVNKNLFEYQLANGPLKINLIYDTRQEATDKLKSLGFNIESTQSSYNSLKTRYDSLTASYNQTKTDLETMIASFESRKTSYEQQVDYWNKQGGAPKPEVQRLQTEHDALADLANRINTAKDNLNKLVDDINAVANILNSLARQLNLNVSTYNTIGQSRGEEFEEGLFIADSSGQHIDIYEFTSKQQLVRLLAHELGHALGLEHVDDPNAIMYRLNSSQNENATSADLTALKQVCGIK